MNTTAFTQAAIFVYFTGAHVSGIWVPGKWLTNQTKVSFVVWVWYGIIYGPYMGLIWFWYGTRFIVVRGSDLGLCMEKTHPPNFLNQWATSAIPFYHVIPVEGMDQWEKGSKVNGGTGSGWNRKWLGRSCDLGWETADQWWEKGSRAHSRWRMEVMWFLLGNRWPWLGKIAGSDQKREDNDIENT